jgi:hypothetical protein
VPPGQRLCHTLSGSGSEKDAATKEGEVHSAVHLPLYHLAIGDLDSCQDFPDRHAEKPD